MGLARKQRGANLGYELASEAVPAALSRDSSEEDYDEGEGDHYPIVVDERMSARHNDDGTHHSIHANASKAFS